MSNLNKVVECATEQDYESVKDLYSDSLFLTPDTSTEEMQAYVQEYVDEKVAELVESAPETLDTLNELAQALGDDPNFATTVSTELGKKANMSDVELYVNNRLSDLGDLNSFNLKNGDLVGSVVMKNATMPNLVGLNGSSSIAIGTGCEAYEGSSLSAGYQCVTSIKNKEEGVTGAGWASQAFGFGTHTVKNCEMAIGHYNAKRGNVLFDVGIGKSAQDNNGVEIRMSGFEVYDGGSGIKVYDGDGNVSFEVLGNGSSKAKTSIVTPAIKSVVSNSERQMMSASGDEGGNTDKFTLNIGDLNYSTIKMLGKTKRPRYVTAESGTTVTSEIALLSDINTTSGGSSPIKLTPVNVPVNGWSSGNVVGDYTEITNRSVQIQPGEIYLVHDKSLGICGCIGIIDGVGSQTFETTIGTCTPYGVAPEWYVLGFTNVKKIFPTSEDIEVQEFLKNLKLYNLEVLV